MDAARAVPDLEPVAIDAMREQAADGLDRLVVRAAMNILDLPDAAVVTEEIAAVMGHEGLEPEVFFHKYRVRPPRGAEATLELWGRARTRR